MSPEFQLGDGLSMHFIGPIGEAECSNLCPRMGQEGVLAYAHAAVRLYRAVNDAQRHLGSRDFYGRDVLSSQFVTDCIHLVGSVKRQEARLVNVDTRPSNFLA